MHLKLDENANVVKPASMTKQLVSNDPTTGAEVWSGAIGDAAAEVATARAAWAGWAAHSVAFRIEALRRFANVVRKAEEEFASLIAKETGKPFWEAKTEVAAVINKVEISIDAYAERTPQRRLEAALGNKIAVRHKPHGVLAVLGPYNFPAHLPNGHIVPALIAGNAVVFKPSEKAPATGAMLVDCFHQAGIPEGVVRLLIGGPEQGKALASEPGSTACCSPARPAPACRSIASSPICPTRSWRLSLAVIIPWSCGRPRTFRPPRRLSSNRPISPLANVAPRRAA